MTNQNLVYMAVRDDGRVGYFATREEIPEEDWTICSPPTRDITDVMDSLRCSKERALVTMNQ